MQWRNSSHPIDNSFLLTILKAFARLLGIQTVEDVRGQAISEVARAAGIYTSQLFRWRICATPRTTVASLCASSSVSERKLQRPSKRGALTFDVAAAGRIRSPNANSISYLSLLPQRRRGRCRLRRDRSARCWCGAGGDWSRAARGSGWRPGTPAWVLMGWRCKALDYSLKRWSALTRFLNDGRLRLSYNAVERELRGARTGPFAGFDEGGRSPICWARLPDHPARGGSSIYCRGMVWIAPAGGLTAALRYAMMVRTTREAAMRAQAFAHTISVDQVDVEALLGGPRRRPDRGGVGRRVPECIMLRTDAWDRLLKSKRDGYLLLPILAFCRDENGESLLDITPDEEYRLIEGAAEFIPACVRARRLLADQCHTRPDRRPSPPAPQSRVTIRAPAALAKSSKNAAAA